MPARAFADAASLALFVFSVCAAAMPRTRISFQFDETFPSDFLTDACGIPVWIHEQGAGTTTLHYDSDGQLVRELDTLAPGATVTIF
jgi:YD repeat-containing protein